MRKFTVISIIFLMFFISTASIISAAEEESQPAGKIELPETVMKAFVKDYPEMVITGLEVETIDGVTYYEIELGEGDLDVIYLADGTRYSVEQEMAVGDLPQEVTDALSASYPDGEIEEAQVITRGTEKSYEVVVLEEDEEEDIYYEVVITADGKIISEEPITEEDDEEAPGAIDANDEDDEE